MWRVMAPIVLAGCAQLAGIEQTTGSPPSDAPDVVVDADVSIDGPPDARPCEGGDARVRDPATGTCYVLFNTPMTRNAARAACLALGAGTQLAKIESATGNAVLATLIGASVAFVGASDEVVEGTFRWEDGSPLVFTNWNAGEPNNANNVIEEDCAVMVGSLGGVWDDRPCAPVPLAPDAGNYAFVCASD